jgi:small subunit ribosomal protein S6
MRHYEVVFIVHPDQVNRSGDDRALPWHDRRGSGQVHRLGTGRRQLAFPIAKVHKAHYVLMNLECDQKTLTELTGAFRFSDAVLRHLVVGMEAAVTEPSPMARSEEENETQRERDEMGHENDISLKA